MLPLIPPRLPQTPDRRGQPESLVKLFERIQKGEHERRSFRERRATPRVAVELDCELDTGEATLMQTTHDLSAFGLALKSGPTPAIGSTLTLGLCLPDDPAKPLELKGVVLGSFDQHGGTRVKFVKPPLDAIRRIRHFLK